MKAVKKTINTYQLKLVRDVVEIFKAIGETEAYTNLLFHLQRLEREQQKRIMLELEHKKARVAIRKSKFAKMLGTNTPPNESIYFKSRDEAESHRLTSQKIYKNRTFGYYLKTVK
jgi:hypothetical protein